MLVFFKTLEEHVQHVQQVIQRLLENQLFIKAEKKEEECPGPVLPPSCLVASTVRDVMRAVEEALVTEPAPDNAPPNCLYVPEAAKETAEGLAFVPGHPPTNYLQEAYPLIYWPFPHFPCYQPHCCSPSPATSPTPHPPVMSRASTP
ncbi:hypothetical protein SKAU_G00232100 [Synaphobranchus kaupii]|uniref:Uncharacterized protein n=1 Tax=Synaphobranchus kaupii TaxID=118154 RepID=A0A9Q1F696_SYNKA|nr:hypothetical protein SKAU_G00232100 [Synaphobranchus kaupii]